MAFSASGTDYRGDQYSRDRASDQVTRAEDNLGRKRKQDRIKESGKRSGLQKLLSAGTRAGIAYATGGASEALGFGGEVDNVMLGTDSEGNAVRNEYGAIVGAGAKLYGGMDAMKQMDIKKLKGEDLAAYERQMKVAGMFPEGSKMRESAILAARDKYGSTQKSQKYGEREGTNALLYDKGRYDSDMTPSQIKGQEVAQERQATALASEGRRQGGQLDGQKELRDAEGIRDARVLASQGRRQGGQLDDQKEIEESFMHPREAAKGASIGRLTNYNAAKKNRELLEDVNKKYEEDQRKSNFDTRGEGGINNLADHRMAKRDQMDDMLDREYNKKISRGGLYSGSKDDVLSFGTEGDRESNESETYRQGPYKDPTGGGQEYFQQGGMGKTFSEKEAEKLSRMDKDNPSVMDDIAFDNKGKALEERGSVLRSYDRLLDPKQGKEDAQHLFEYKQREKEALEEEWRKSNTAHLPPPISTEMEDVIKSKLTLDRLPNDILLDALRGIGGINVA